MSILLTGFPRAPQRRRSQSMVRLAVCCEILESRRLMSMGFQPVGQARTACRTPVHANGRCNGLTSHRCEGPQ